MSHPTGDLDISCWIRSELPVYPNAGKSYKNPFNPNPTLRISPNQEIVNKNIYNTKIINVLA
ncbi:MAG: hypothetical protein QXV01_12670 [Candidatus Bathyarchaeia archaeon]